MCMCVCVCVFVCVCVCMCVFAYASRGQNIFKLQTGRKKNTAHRRKRRKKQSIWRWSNKARWTKTVEKCVCVLCTPIHQYHSTQGSVWRIINICCHTSYSCSHSFSLDTCYLPLSSFCLHLKFFFFISVFVYPCLCFSTLSQTFSSFCFLTLFLFFFNLPLICNLRTLHVSHLQLITRSFFFPTILL